MSPSCSRSIIRTTATSRASRSREIVFGNRQRLGSEEVLGREQDGSQRAGTLRDGRGLRLPAGVERSQVCLRVRTQKDVLRCDARHRRSPLRIASTIEPEAVGTQMRPLLPSAMPPACARKRMAALRL